MIFVINNLKYDTDKMELISDECEYWYKGELLGTPMRYRGRDVRLWRSSKGNWLLTYKSDYTTYGKALCEKITSWMNGERFVSGSRAFRIVS